MIASKMRYNLLLLLDNLLEYGAPAYDDAQISALLTKAQSRVFRQKYDPGFEMSEERRRELDQLVRPAHYDSTDVPGSTIIVSSSQVGIHNNGTLFDLPTDFQFAIEESAVTNTSDPEEVRIRPVTHDEYLANIKNPYKTPTIESGVEVFWRMDINRKTHAIGDSSETNKRTEIITEGGTITNYRLKYLATPVNIVVDSLDSSNEVHCELDSIVHPDIVDEAYKIAEAAIRPENYQIAFNELKDSRN